VKEEIEFVDCRAQEAYLRQQWHELGQRLSHSETPSRSVLNSDMRSQTPETPVKPV
jgi:hypothetical protein